MLKHEVNGDRGKRACDERGWRAECSKNQESGRPLEHLVHDVTPLAVDPVETARRVVDGVKTPEPLDAMALSSSRNS